MRQGKGGRVPDANEHIVLRVVYFVQGKEELVQRKALAATSSSKDKDKDKSKKDKKGKDSSNGPKLPDKSPQAELLSKHKAALKTVKEWRASEDMIQCQLTVMSDRLPPLSPFTSDFRLDPWQKRVLRLIDQRKSVVISAPTSSGKTIISTYVAALGRLVDRKPVAAAASKGPANPPALHGTGDDEIEEVEGDEEDDGEEVAVKDRVLFVVPTEPLVWQVAAHFSGHIMSGSVALVTNQLTYCPQKKANEPPGVVVGTPRALESALSKIRGRSGMFETNFQIDRSQMVGGFDHYGWVVYDEVHVLDGEDGESLQRLIRMMNCNFLALSATVGNAEQLRSWMEKVRGEQLQVEVVNAPPPEETNVGIVPSLRSESQEESVARADAADSSRLVKLQEHEGRFLNIQRHVWNRRAETTTTPEGSNQFELQLLHPLSAITLDFLQTDGFKKSSLPMTPRDSYVMWEAMRDVYPTDAIADLDPHRFFSSDASTRITLKQSKDYEDVLKQRLEELSKSHETETQQLLDRYNLSDMSEDYDICEMVMHLKGQSMLPCLIFHLNVFELIQLFRSLLGGIEAKQKAAHPNYYFNLQQRVDLKRMDAESVASSTKTKADMEDAMRDGIVTDTVEVVDYRAPHPDFVLSPAGPISSKEFDDICKEVQSKDKFPGDFSKHALMRALRRGIGLYINDHHFTAYRRAIMRLALQGKLGVVLSDSSLAYGVNMPFRTCVFCGEMGGKLDTLMAQQMAGRSGRRGLDTQGHLVYAGARSSFIRELMLARIPAITGREPRYHTMFLQEMLSKYVNPADFFPHQMATVGGQTLGDYCQGINSVPNFRAVSIETLLALGLIEECDKLTPEEEMNLRSEEFARSRQEGRTEGIDFTASRTPTGYRPTPGKVSCHQLWMMWEMRENLSDSIFLGCMLPDLHEEFIHRRADAAGDDVSVQLTFLLFLLHTIDRVPFRGDLGEGFLDVPLHEHPFVVSRGLGEKLTAWTERLSSIEATINGLNVPHKEWMLPEFPHGEPLDATLFHSLVNPTYVTTLPPQLKQLFKERYLSLSMKLILMHNNLMSDSVKYGRFEMLTRYATSCPNYMYLM